MSNAFHLCAEFFKRWADLINSALGTIFVEDPSCLKTSVGLTIFRYNLSLLFGMKKTLSVNTDQGDHFYKTRSREFSSKIRKGSEVMN